jgi:Zn-dependent protease
MKNLFQTITLGKVLGIPIKIHWTFILLLLYISFDGFMSGKPQMVYLTLFLFLCVVLHEYGHALMARRFGIGTEDIILSPIGGVARLQKIPEEPMKEISIAFAGPFVNLVIALIALVFIKLTSTEGILEPAIFEDEWTGENIARGIFFTNTILFLFNLLPAFPMDGGRILRACLAWKWGRALSTRIASIIGKLIAIGFIAFGLFNSDWIMAVLGLFVLVSANSENAEVSKNEILSQKFIKDYVNSNFTKLHIGDLMSKPIHLLKTKGEANFVVYDSLNYIVGTIPTLYILEAIKREAQNEYTSQWLNKEIVYISISQSLKEAYTSMNEKGAGILLVIDESSQIVGTVDRNTVMRVMDFGI